MNRRASKTSRGASTGIPGLRRESRRPGAIPLRSTTTARGLAASLCLGVFAALAPAPPAAAGEPSRELHGAADAFGAPGIALAWAVLRGVDETAALVVVRLVADPARYASVSATGVDPFTQQRKPLLAATASAAVIELRVRRAQFADFPRSEFRFAAAANAGAPAAPDVVVFYAGVPDTAPEFASAPELDRYLAARIARISADGATK